MHTCTELEAFFKLNTYEPTYRAVAPSDYSMLINQGPIEKAIITSLLLTIGR